MNSATAVTAALRRKAWQRRLTCVTALGCLLLMAALLRAPSAGAAERLVTLRPESDRASGWSRSNSAVPRWAHLDDALKYRSAPAILPNADYLWTYTTGDVYGANLQTVQKQAGERVSKVAFYLYAYADSGYKASLYAGAKSLATVSVPVGDSNWFRSTYTGGDLTQAEIDDMHFMLDSVTGTSGAYAQVVYAEVTLSTAFPQSVETGFGSFSAGNWPSAAWRPYADSAMFNRPIAARRAVRANSSAIVDHILTVTPDWDPSGEWRPSGGVNPIVVHATQQAADNDGGYPPTYWPRSSDPLVTVHCTEAWGTCEIEGHQIRVPSSARPAGPSDAHMTVVDQASGWEYDMWQVQTKPPYTNGQTILISWGGRTQVKGDGLDSNATAAHYGNLAGTVRAEEWMAGTITHAFTIAVPCTNGQKVNGAGGEGHVCESWRRPEDAPAMGELLHLDISLAEIDAMAVPAWKKTILRALATYGAYVVDTDDYLSIQLEHPSTYLSFGYQHPLEQFAQQNGILPSPLGTYTFDLAGDVPWRRMRVLAP